MPRFYPSIPLLAALLVSSSMALADPEDSWNLNAGISTTYDSNLFRLPDAQASSDRITGTTIGLRVNKPYSLQRFTVDASMTDYRFSKNDRLDYLGKNLNAAWLWSVTPRLRGNLSTNYSESLNSFVDFRNTSRNIRTIQGGRFDAELEVWGRWRLLGGVNYTEQKNSQPFLAESDYSAKAAEYGLKYAMPSGSTLSLIGRRTSGEYARRVVNPLVLIDSGFEQTDTEMRLLWLATGKSRVSGRLAYIDREHDNFAVRNYAGYVGNLDYTWDIGGKLRLNLGYRQDLASFQNLESSYYKLSAWNISPIWTITGKTALRARYNRETRDYQGAPVAALAGREDTLTQAQLAFDWLPLRTLTLLTFVQRDTRDSNRANADFKSNMAGVSANLSF